MEGNNSDTQRPTFDPVDTHLDAVCPHCDREERFDDESTARAWLTGHIQEEHSDELPRYEGTEK